MRVFETVGNLVQFADRFRPRPPATADAPSASGGGSLETRLAGVVVAALKEAFDRDRVRMEIEREQIDAERRRAEQALQAELRRQAIERGLGQLRLVAIMGLGTWMLSAALAALLPGMRAGVPRVLLGMGWAFAFASIACAFAASQRSAAWHTSGGDIEPGGTATAAPWLLVCGFTLVGASLLAAL